MQEPVEIQKQKPPQRIDEFILTCIEKGYTCFLIGEKHSGCKSGLEALSEIAPQLQFYSQTHQISFVVFDENIHAVDEKVPLPITQEQLHHSGKNEIQATEILQEHGILIFGLENAKTNPIPNMENATFEKTNEFLKSMGLFEHFIQDQSQSLFLTNASENLDNTANKILNMIGIKAYRDLALSTYAKSDYRLTFPNEEFSKYIEQIPNTVICLNVVGSKHITLVRRNEEIIDEGMEQRLREQKKTVSTFVIPASEIINAPYFIDPEHDVIFSAIAHVSQAVPTLTIILDQLNKQILELQHSSSWLDSKEDLKAALKFFKAIIIEATHHNKQDLFAKFVDTWLECTADFVQNKKSSIKAIISQNNQVVHFIAELRKKYGDMALSELKGVLPVKSYKEKLSPNLYKSASDYQKLLEKEEHFIKRINLLLTNNDYLHSDKFLEQKINQIKPILKEIEELRTKQSAIIATTMEQKQLVRFLEIVFEDKPIASDTLIKNIVTFVTQYLRPKEFTDDDERGKLALMNYHRYINAVIHRYFLGVDGDSLSELLDFLNKGKQTIEIMYGGFDTEVDPYDQHNKKCVQHCVMEFQTTFTQYELDEQYNKDPQAFQLHCLSTIYKGKPNQHVQEIKYLLIKLQDSGLHNLYLGIEKGRVRFYYSPEYMTIFHEELHELRILQGETGPEKGYLPAPLNDIYDCLEEYFNISIGNHNEAFYCKRVLLPERIGHNGIVLGSMIQNASYDTTITSRPFFLSAEKAATWQGLQQKASFIYERTAIIDTIYLLIDEQIVTKLATQNQDALARNKLQALFLLKFKIARAENKTLNEIINEWKEIKLGSSSIKTVLAKGTSSLSPDNKSLNFIKVLLTDYGNVVVNPTKTQLKEVCRRKLRQAPAPLVTFDLSDVPTALLFQELQRRCNQLPGLSIAERTTISSALTESQQKMANPELSDDIILPRAKPENVAYLINNLLLNVLNYLEPKDLFRTALVSKLWCLQSGEILSYKLGQHAPHYANLGFFHRQIQPQLPPVSRPLLINEEETKDEQKGAKKEEPAHKKPNLPSTSLLFSDTEAEEEYDPNQLIDTDFFNDFDDDFDDEDLDDGSTNITPK